MSIARYHTLGAVAPDLGSLNALARRLEEAGVEPGSLLALSRRKDEKTVRVALPEARTLPVETNLTRAQKLELGSSYLGVTSVSVLMGAVYLPVGVAVQAVITVAVILGLVIFRRTPRLKRKVVDLGLPESLAGRWEEAFASGFALALVVVPEPLSDVAQEAFLEDGSLIEPLAVDRRPVL